MKKFTQKSVSLLLVLLMVVSLLPQITLQSNAQTVDYVYDGKYIYNWGQRGTTATFLSQNAEAFYTKNGTSYDELSALAGSSSTSSVPSSALYQELKSLMSGAQTYQTSYEATKNLFQYTDCQNSGGKISSFYSGTPIGPSWDSTWNREHTWPNSKGDQAGSGEDDIMMLRPTASSENSSRGNKAYGENSGYYNPNSESNGTYDLRGDVARIMLFTYTRWGCTNLMWGSNGVIESKELLLRWVKEDPVDTWELGRNDAVESITGTRNVYVDYPELVFILFDEPIPAGYTTPSGEGAGSSYTITATSNNNSYGTVSVSGRNINAVPNTGYYAAGATVLSGAATVTQNGNTFAVDATSDCTIRIDFAAKTSLSLSFSENGKLTTQSVYSGESINLPNATATVPDGYSFIGWTTGAVSDTENKPDTVHPAGSAYPVNAEQTLYALYTYRDDEGSGNGNVFELFTGTLVEGDYILTYQTSADFGAMKASISSSRFEYSVISLTDDAIENPSSDIIWHIAPVSGGYTIYNASTSSYAAGNGTKNQGKLVSDVTDYATWTVTGSETYEFVNVGNKAKGVNANLRRNNGFGFACYSTSTGGALTLYKSTGGTVYYTTNASSCTHSNTSDVPATPATCTETGFTSGVRCNDCQIYISGHQAVAALGHSWGKWTELTPPECDFDGTESRTCATCGEQQTQAIAQTGHSWTSVVTPPTTTTQGYTSHTCNYCGEINQDTYTWLVAFSTPGGVNSVQSMACSENGITLPSAEVPTGDVAYSFVGWVAEQTEDTVTEPTVYMAGETYIADKYTILYALYSYVVEGTSGSGDYVKVTQAPADWSGEYVIVYEGGNLIFDGSLTEMDAANNYQSVTITDNTISAAQADAYKFTVAAVDGGYSIQSASGLYIGRESSKNGLDAGSAALVNTFSLNDDGTTKIISSVNTYLRFNTASNQMRFRYYGSGQQAICLYVKDGSTGTPHYTTQIGAENPVDAMSVTLSDDIGVNFKLTGNHVLTKAEVGGEQAEFTQNDDGTVTVHVTAAQMADEILLYVDNQPLNETYSVKEYAEKLLKDETHSDKWELVKSMLVYGSAAQKYFAHNLTSLADANVTDFTPTAPEGTVTGRLSGKLEQLQYYGATLLHKNRIAVRIYFTGDAEGLTFTVNETVTEVQENETGYYVEVGGYKPQDLNTAVVVEVTDAEGNTMRVSYSPMDYILRMYNKESSQDTTKALVMALYSFYRQAAAYSS